VPYGDPFLNCTLQSAHRPRNRQDCHMDNIRKAKDWAREVKADRQWARRENLQRTKATPPACASS
jgi:hypothetical protein